MALSDQLPAGASGTSPTPAATAAPGRSTLTAPAPTDTSPPSRAAALDSHPADPAPRSLWRHRDFVALLFGETISQLGSQITLFALPLAAVLVLNANGGQIGLLKTLFTLPYFILPLAVGVLLDRRPRRPAMMLANAGRMLLVLSIPVLAALKFLTMTQLYVVALLGGALSVVFDLAYSSFLPTLIGRKRLGEANSFLQTGYSAAFLAGPGVAGLLVGWLGAATTLVADAVSYLLSLLNIGALRFREPPPAMSQTRRRPFAEAKEGLVAVFRIAPIRQITLHSLIFNTSVQLIEVAFVVYALNVVNLGPTLFGAVVTIGGVGGLAGALLGAKLAKRLGYGPATVVAAIAESLIFILLPMVHGSRPALVAMFGGTFAVAGAGTGIASVLVATIRQSYTPDRMMARVGAGFRMVNSAAIPLGSAIAGALVTAIGIRPTLWVAPIGLVASLAPLVFTSFRRIRKLPELDQTPAPAPA